ncbi:PREDICTED: probable WRKY transcription factor 41 [Populus euphratica]|uniref:Probable WRKY transcription factor 41 n=1 Tax=Populus euphratica TaxID=75702 RepID=A0AAJ6UD31_POPEU|nr:PREDICTED: probable WRKY transcription factor 41 [Populus euphratica]
MENGWSWEQKTLITELIQGMELAKQLRAHLNATSSVESRDMLVRRILSSYEKALLILNWGGSMGQPQNAGVSAGVPESPISINGSSRSDDFDGSVKDNQGYNEALKKRKTTPRWTDQVRVSTDNGLEGHHDDGFSWRKYGQKDILGAKYPRSYYRCTYRNTQNCWATKQVQRSDEDPTVFEITYRGTHSCAHGNQSAPSLEKQEKKLKNTNNNCHQQQSQQALFNFHNSLRVNTEDLDNKEMVSPFSFPPTNGCTKSEGSFSPFISPATPEPTHYSLSPFQMNNFVGVQNLQHLESDFTDIISANTSATNSPIVDLDFSLDQVDLDPDFPFDSPGFFS